MGVEPDAVPEKAGVIRGDVIRQINRQPVMAQTAGLALATSDVSC
jgi:hypothetical protein